MKAPKTMPELREALAFIMAGAINGDVKQDEGRMALNAAFATNQRIDPTMKLAGEIFEVKKIDPEAPLAIR